VASQQPVEIGNLRDVLEFVERDERAIPAALVEPERKVEQCMERRQGVDVAWIELELRADPERAEREPEPGALEELFDLRLDRALQRVYARSNRIATSAMETTR
jgi:hypothetical protein